MPRRDVTLTDKTALLGRIKNQPPNTSHRQLAEITGVLKPINCELIGHHVTDKREFPENGSVKVRFQTFKRSSVSSPLS
jgi:hypothetical protein